MSDKALNIDDLLTRPDGEWHDRQLSKEESLALFDSGQWKSLTDEQLFNLAFFQQKLCIPFGELHRVAEKVFGRPVFTHEFAFRSHQLAELRGQKPKSNIGDVVDLLPKEKVFVVDAEEKPLTLRKLI